MSLCFVAACEVRNCSMCSAASSARDGMSAEPRENSSRDCTAYARFQQYSKSDTSVLFLAMRAHWGRGTRDLGGW
eukprot:6198576-Pleurochrysis_carterae.AAC.2